MNMNETQQPQMSIYKKINLPPAKDADIFRPYLHTHNFNGQKVVK